MTDVTTALTLVIPVEFHNDINNIREQFDRAYPRWMPHINFIFPFVPLDEFSNISQKLQNKLEGFGNFTLELSDVGSSPQGNNVTFHLKPKNKDEIKKLFDIITEALPDIKTKHVFNPHLTLGQCKKNEINQKINEIKELLPEGITFTVGKIYLINRTKDDPFKMHTVITLN